MVKRPTEICPPTFTEFLMPLGKEGGRDQEGSRDIDGGREGGREGGWVGGRDSMHAYGS